MKLDFSRNAVSFFLTQAICFAAAGVGGGITATSVRTWYQELQKPVWNPPEWIFGPVWSVLYFMMGVSVWLVWRSGGYFVTRTALILFGVQLVLNVIWSALFFGARNPGLAFMEILMLWIAIVATITFFWPHSKVASWLLFPYLAWSSFAAYLNFTIWRMN